MDLRRIDYCIQVASANRRINRFDAFVYSSHTVHGICSKCFFQTSKIKDHIYFQNFSDSYGKSSIVNRSAMCENRPEPRREPYQAKVPTPCPRDVVVATKLCESKIDRGRMQRSTVAIIL